MPDHLKKLAKAIARAHEAHRAAELEYELHKDDFCNDSTLSLKLEASKVRVNKLLDRLVALMDRNP